VIRILSADQIRRADQYTIASEPVAGIDLMERAAKAFTAAFITKFPATVPVFIFCGYGNNGGDGLAIGRMLLQYHYDVRVFLLADQVNYSGDLLTNKSRFTEIRSESLHLVETADQFPGIPSNAIIVDALFGSGLNKPLTGVPELLVNLLNSQQAIRVAVDIPSGLFADAPSTGTVFKADHTITFQQPKLAFLFPENHTAIGELQVVDIRLNTSLMYDESPGNFIVEINDIKSRIHPRNKFDHKGTYGHAFIHAGNEGKMGAAILCTAACTRTGAGLTTVHVPKGQTLPLNASIPEVMTKEYAQNKDDRYPSLSNYTSVAIGPGMGTDENAKKNLLHLLKETKIPRVLDADALTILSQEKKGLKLLPEHTIVTPHPKEFERLFGKTSNWLDRHQLQIKGSVKHRIYIVLKGAYTCISTPEARSYFNPTGNPGMAKGGSGDVLTGMIGSLLAQRYTPEDACLVGVYLHGLAADIGVQKQSEHSLLASDIIGNIGNAFNEVLRQAE
jgi:hydroxyethylthiazole kinase-like uncharacterized protein yjeF